MTTAVGLMHWTVYGVKRSMYVPRYIVCKDNWLQKLGPPVKRLDASLGRRDRVVCTPYTLYHESHPSFCFA